MADEYISTDPNAGKEGYLSTDPNAGLAEQPQAVAGQSTLPSPQGPVSVGTALKHAGEAAVNVATGFAKGFLPRPELSTLAEIVGGPAAIGPIEAYKTAQGVGQTVKSVQEAEKTAPYSRERFEAGFNVLAQLGMAATGVRGAIKRPSLTETLFGEKPPIQQPLAAEKLAESEVIKNAAQPNRETGALPTEQGVAPVQETAVKTEIGDTRETPAQVPAQEVAPVPQPEQQIRTAIDRMDFEEQHSGASELALDLEKIKNLPPSLNKALQDFREAQVVDREEYGERSGLVSEHGDKLEAEARKFASPKTTSVSTQPEVTKPTTDISPILNAKSEKEMVSIGGQMMIDAKTDADSMAIQSAMKQWGKPLTKEKGGVGEEVQKVEGQKGEEGRVLEGVAAEPPAAAAPPTEPPKSISESPDPANVTSIKNEIVDRERAARGLEPVVQPARKAFGESWEQASKKINDDPQYVDDLLKDLRKKPRALTDVEDAALLHRQIDLQNRFDKTAADLVKAQEIGDADAIAENRVRHAALSDQLLDLYNVGKESGTETGRGLAARKLLADENFTLANMVTQKRAALQGKPLTPEQQAEVEGYNKDILEADRKLQEYEKQPKKESARLKAAKTRMESATTELERRMAFSDFEKAQRAEPIKLDKEGLQLRANLERKKQEFWQSLTKDRLEQRTLTEKVQDTFTKWRRGFILSSPNVLAKLTSAAVERMAFTPMEEATGKVLSKLPGISQVAERSSFHPSVKSEARAITEGFTAGMKDAWDVLRTGRSGLDVEFGKKNVMPPSAIDFIGQIHGALKTIPKRNEFARRFQQGVETAIENGVDPTDPLVQTRIATQAYKEANRSIFLQDNRVVAAWQRGISALEQPSKTTGQVPPGSKALATTMKVLFPIVKVPTNIVAETLQYSTGLVTGSVRLGNAFRKGIQNLKPEQADLIMRELKKGSVGGAALLLGYLNADKIGGYYQPGKKRDKEDVGFGKVRVFGVDIPSYLIHNPLLEQLQIGATIRRVSDSKLRKKDIAPQGLTEGIMAAALGVTEEVPFVRETLGELPKLFRANERKQFLGEFAKSLAIPAVVQWAAYQMDKRGGEPVKRETKEGSLPEVILQNIESGIPGLRQKLPEKQQRSRARQPFASVAQ